MTTVINSLKPVTLLVIVLMLAACTGGQQQTATADAVAMITQYYQSQQSGRLEQAAALYEPESRQRWLAFLQDAEQKRGAVQQFSIEAVEPNTVYSGKYFLVIVHVSGSKATATESVTLFDKLSEDETYIVSHKLKVHHD